MTYARRYGKPAASVVIRLFQNASALLVGMAPFVLRLGFTFGLDAAWFRAAVSILLDVFGIVADGHSIPRSLPITLP